MWDALQEDVIHTCHTWHWDWFQKQSVGTKTMKVLYSQEARLRMVDRRSWVCLKQPFLAVADGLNCTDVIRRLFVVTCSHCWNITCTLWSCRSVKFIQVPLRMVIVKDLSSVMLENNTWPTLAKPISLKVRLRDNQFSIGFSLCFFTATMVCMERRRFLWSYLCSQENNQDNAGSFVGVLGGRNQLE